MFGELIVLVCFAELRQYRRFRFSHRFCFENVTFSVILRCHSHLCCDYVILSGCILLQIFLLFASFHFLCSDRWVAVVRFRVVG